MKKTDTHAGPCATLLAVLLAGCATINSERASDRLAAVRAIADQDELYAAIDKTRYQDVRREAVSRLERTDLLARIVERDDLPPRLRLDAVGRIRDPDELVRFVLSEESDWEIRETALAGIAAQRALEKCVLRSGEPRIQSLAAARITDEAASRRILSASGIDEEAKDSVLENVRNQAFLFSFVTNRANGTPLRRKASDRIDDPGFSLELAAVRPPLEEWVLAPALDRISDESALFAFATNRDNPVSLRKTAIGRVADPDLCLAVLKARPLYEDWMLFRALDGSQDPAAVLDLFRDSGAPAAVRARTASFVTDEDALRAVVTERNDPDDVRRAALDRISSREAFEALLSVRPALEDWICSEAVDHADDRKVLFGVALGTDFADGPRRTAIGKVRGGKSDVRLFLESTDALPAMEVLSGLPEDFIDTDEAQDRLLALLDQTGDTGSRTRIFPFMDGNVDLEQPRFQRMIADTVLAADSPDMRAFASDNLFDSDVIERLALEGGEDLAFWALSLRPDAATAARIVFRSRNVAIQCRALSLVVSGTALSKIAREGPSRAVRQAALFRLGAPQSAVVAALAEDPDPEIRASALLRLRALGDEKSARALEKKQEDRRRRAEAAAEAARKKQEADDRAAEANALKMAAAIAGRCQVHAFRHYLEVKATGKLSQPRSFSFTGRAREVGTSLIGNLLSGKKRVVLDVEAGRGETFRATINLDNALPGGIKTGDILTLGGAFESGDANQVELVHGILVSQGVPR